MIGAIVGSAMAAGSAIYGGIKSAQANKTQRRQLAQRQRENQAWFDREYNVDPTQRASAQHLITQLNDNIRKRNQAAAGAEAVSGGTGEKAAAAREQNNEAIGRVASAINAQGDARRDHVEDVYFARKNNLSDAQNNLKAEKSENIARAVAAAGQTAGSVATSLDSAPSTKVESNAEYMKKNGGKIVDNTQDVESTPKPDAIYHDPLKDNDTYVA